MTAQTRRAPRFRRSAASLAAFTALSGAVACGERDPEDRDPNVVTSQPSATTSSTTQPERTSTMPTAPTSVVGGEPGRENRDDQSPPTSGGVSPG